MVEIITKRFNNIYQFKITLEGIKPLIWRRIQVPENSFNVDIVGTSKKVFFNLKQHLKSVY
jgi:hypothetical protein